MPNRPWRKDVFGDVVGCDMEMSPTKPAIGAPTAMASTAAIKCLLVFIDECLVDSDRCWRAYRETDLQIDLRSDLNAARISAVKSSGCSQAAKWPPLGSLL